MSGKESLAKVYWLDDYRAKPNKKTADLLTQQAFEELLGKISNNDYSIDGLLLSYMMHNGYKPHRKTDFERQLYICRQGAKAHYISNHDFLTDKPALCTITLEHDTDCETLEGRFVEKTGSIARLERSGVWQRNDPRAFLLLSGGIGMLAAAGAYSLYGATESIVMAVVSIGVPLSCYLIGRHTWNRDKQGLLPPYLARQQIDAAVDPQRFFEETFGVKVTSFITWNTPDSAR